MKLTVEQVMALKPCEDYPAERIAELLKPTEGELTIELLTSIPMDDARWFVSRLLNAPSRIVWAKACAGRAKDYAAYATAADAAARYASSAAYAAADAANAAADAAARYASSAANAAAFSAAAYYAAAHAAAKAAKAAAFSAAAKAADADAEAAKANAAGKAEHLAAMKHVLELLQ